MNRLVVVGLAAAVFAGCATAPRESAAPKGDWAGRKVAVFGDSISDKRLHGWGHWWQFVGDELGCEMRVYAQNGCQWSGVPGQVKALARDCGGDVDAILILMGTNDFNSNVPLGAWWKESEETVNRNGKLVAVRRRLPDFNGGTLRGRINIALNKIKGLYPDRQVVLLTPISRGYFTCAKTNVQPEDSYSNALGLYVADYARAIREAGEVWSVPVIDTHSESGLVLSMPAYSDCCNRATTDRLHPNTEGNRRLARTVAARLRALPATFRPAVSPKVVLDFPSQRDNPRSSEGDFIRLKDGRILYVYSHYVKGSGADHDPAFLAARESSDGGRTWSTNSVPVVANEGGMNVMSVSLVRLDADTIALFYLRKNSTSDCRPLMRTSTDEGKTWSAPTVCVPDAATSYYVMNNCRLLAMKSGRLVLPLSDHGQKIRDGHGKLVCYLSDDRGKTWRRGRAEPFATFAANGDRVVTQEPGLVELKDGRVLMYARTTSGRQWYYYSSDGCETWTKGEPGPLLSPCAPATLKWLKNGDLLAVWNDHEWSPQFAKAGPAWAHGIRTPLTLGISRDGGRTWPIRRNLAADADGWYCYYGVLEIDDRLLISCCAHDNLTHAQIFSVPIDWIYSR